MSYQEVKDEEKGNPEVSADPDPSVLSAGDEEASLNWKRHKVPSRNDLIVYEYDLVLNRYKPYMAGDVKLGEGYPQREINQLFDEMNTNIARPPKIKRILYVTAALAGISAICLVVAEFFEVEVHEKALTIILFLVSFIPLALTFFMLFILGYAYFVLVGRRDNIRLSLELRNQEVFDSYGIRLQAHESCEWIVAEILEEGTGRGVGGKRVTGQTRLTIGGNKSKKGGRDTSQGLLGDLEGVDFED